MLLRATLPATIDIRPQIETTAGAVLADPTQMHQVLINLCTNAEHAMRETGGVLEIRFERVEVTAALPTPHPPSIYHVWTTPRLKVFARNTSSKDMSAFSLSMMKKLSARWGQLTLEPLGYHVVACTNGTEALEDPSGIAPSVRPPDHRPNHARHDG